MLLGICKSDPADSVRLSGLVAFGRCITMGTLEQLLQSTSDTLFPADMGEHRVAVNSRDVDGEMIHASGERSAPEHPKS